MFKILSICLLLGGCATTACPPLVEFDQNEELILELESCPNTGAIQAALADWVTLRDQIRMCQ